MKVGDLAECAIWIEGTESEAMLRQWKNDCGYIMARSQEPVMILGPVSFEIKRPGEDRVPQVPSSVKGPNVRLLIATAEVLAFEMVTTQSFVGELDKRDLKRLRAATRQSYGNLPDNVCDQIIERLGPVAGGTLH